MLPPENRDTKPPQPRRKKQPSATWNARDFSTAVSDPDNIIEVSGNQFIPIAGTYKLTGTPDGKVMITKTD